MQEGLRSYLFFCPRWACQGFHLVQPGLEALAHPPGDRQRGARERAGGCEARRGCCARGRQRARGHVAHRGEVPGVGRVDGECAARDSRGA